MYTRKEHMRAFTLIELLVAIAIIGILAAVIFMSISAARERARDTARAADIQTVKSALELYYFDKRHYPPLYGEAPYEETRALVHLASSLASYLPRIPADPVHGNSDKGYLYYGRKPSGEPDRDKPQGYVFRVYLERLKGYCYTGIGPTASAWSTNEPRCPF